MNSLDKLDLRPRIRNKLETAKINSDKQLFEASNDDLLKANLSEAEIQLVKLRAAKMCNLNISCALDVRGSSVFQRLSVGCPKLDTFLRGGIAVGGITEIVGESGSGKTQLCLQMALMVQYPVTIGGLEGGAVYICTEGVFPSVRLQQLSHTFVPSSQTDSCSKSSETNKIKFGDNIFIQHIADAESLKQCLMARLPQLLVRNNVKLVILDSIAGVFRADYEPHSGASRAKDLQCVGVQLHKLAEQFKTAIVCVNQVTDIPSKESGKHQSVAALGLAWANLVTTRIQLFRTSQRIRTMEVVYSPHLPSECCHFSVAETGVAAIL